MQHQHADQGERETEQALPAHDLDRLDARTLQEELLEDELGGREDLGAGDQDDAQGGAQRLGSRGVLRGPAQGVGNLGLGIGPDDAGESHQGDACHDADEGDPLEEVQVAAQEDDAEQADEQDQGAARHLVDRGRHHEQAGVDERGAEDVADGGQREEQDAEAPQEAVGAAGTLSGWGASERVFRVDARGIVRVRVVAVAHGLVPVGAGAVLLPGHEALVRLHQADDEPASDLADEHLRRLQHGLLEGPAVLGVGVVAVPDALVILECGGG